MCERKRESVCVCVCVREKESVSKRERECVYVCVRERESKRESEREIQTLFIINIMNKMAIFTNCYLGGFIWDFVDQGLLLPGLWGGFGYGGDFGDIPNSKQFCINGILGKEIVERF